MHSGTKTRRKPFIAAWLPHQDVACWSLSPDQVGKLRESLPEAEVKHCESREEFLEVLPEADVAMVWVFRQEWFDRAGRLRLIATPAAGRDYFQIDPPDGVEIGYGAFHGQIMAETVLGMMLGVSRGLFDGLERWRQGRVWDRGELSRSMFSFRGSRITILGFGAIGGAVARLSKGLGGLICGVRRSSVAPPEWFSDKDRMVSPAKLDEVLPTTDHLVLCLPGGPATDEIIDGRRLGLLPARAAVYNIGRGNAINEEALVKALREGRLKAACLDVFAKEPLARSTRLRRAPNLLALPHVSAVAPEYLDLYLKEFVDLFRRRFSPA